LRPDGILAMDRVLRRGRETFRTAVGSLEMITVALLDYFTVIVTESVAVV
jgi:hypothetical protein